MSTAIASVLAPPPEVPEPQPIVEIPPLDRMKEETDFASGLVDVPVDMVDRDQAPDSEPSLTPVFLSSTCFRPPGAAQQQSGFLNFTSGSV